MIICYASTMFCRQEILAPQYEAPARNYPLHTIRGLIIFRRHPYRFSILSWCLPPRSRRRDNPYRGKLTEHYNTADRVGSSDVDFRTHRTRTSRERAPARDADTRYPCGEENEMETETRTGSLVKHRCDRFRKRRRRWWRR